jgi:modulator of FtsH protease
MNRMANSVTRTQTSILATNKVLKNTYMLLSLTLLFSALMAGVSATLNVPFMAATICSFAGIGLVWFVLPKFENSTTGIFVVFAFAGLLGFGIGPMISHYLTMPGGPRIVTTALGGTGLIFLGLSAYVLTSKRDFSFMGGMLFTGLMVIFAAMIANIFLAIPALSLALSAAIVLLMSGLILFDTSRIVNGGETNYIRATVSLYLNIHNLFVSLLHLLTAFGGDD